MKYKNMKSKKMKQYYSDRNLSANTIYNYKVTVKHFEKVTGLTIDEMIDIAKKENKKEWEETKLYAWLTEFRKWLYENYKLGSAKIHMGRIKAIFNHYRIKQERLSYFSTKQVKISEEIDYEDLPTKAMLKKCIEFKNPLLKALTLFMSSGGMSRIDTWEMTIQKYLNATFEYHQCNNIYEAIKIMDRSEIDIIPTFKLRRRKTGETYRSFISPEAVKAINNYLLTRDNLKNTDKLFDVNFSYLNTMFKETNDKLGFGQINGQSRFCPQMLRSYHASQLAEAGVNDHIIELLQGRKPQTISRKSYIRVKRESLKEAYVKALPYIVVEDIEEVRTELTVEKEKNKELSVENKALKEQNDKTNERLDNLEKIILGNVSESEIFKLDKLL